MIVWLASYPRSGNTLLRTVLRQTLDRDSWSDEADPDVAARLGMDEDAGRVFGQRHLDEPWDEFHARASASPDTFFVKTHLPPRDGQPAIYVARDGRRTLLSYLRFHRRYQPNERRTLLQLVVGDDYYGGWTEHHRMWTGDPGRRVLVVRYEDLCVASPALLESLARFAGIAAVPRPWVNPFEDLHNAHPGFFASGEARWDGDPEWTRAVDGSFFELHGGLMEALGYASRDDVEAARSGLDRSEIELLSLSSKLVADNRELRKVCNERQSVIETLDRACRERLALIERLSKAPGG